MISDIRIGMHSDPELLSLCFERLFYKPKISKSPEAQLPPGRGRSHGDMNGLSSIQRPHFFTLPRMKSPAVGTLVPCP